MDIQSEICLFETAGCHSCLMSDPKCGNRGVVVSYRSRRYRTQEYLRDIFVGPNT